MNATSAHLSRSRFAATGIQSLKLNDARRGALTRVRRMGLAVFAVQLLVLLVWSGLLAARHTQTGDFAGFFQSWYLIGHGDLIPPGWFQAQAILIQWPLALLALAWPHPVTLLVAQDLAIVGAELVAYLWICDLVAEREDVPVTRYSLTGLALLALDPWIYWSASWDYHSEPIGTLFAVLAARDLFRGRRIAALWCFLTLLSGLITAPYLVGLGISLLVARRNRKAAIATAIAGAAWFEAMYKLGAGGAIGTLSGVRTHAVSTLFSRIAPAIPAFFHYWLDAVANVAPAGLIGVFTAPAIGIATVTLGENYSQGTVGNVRPSFQGIPLYVFVPVGTIVALIWLHRRFGNRLANGLALLMVLNVMGWAVVWIPAAIPTWLRVSPAQASAITYTERLIPRRDAVVAEQGIAGDFATHRHWQTFLGGAKVALSSPYTWFIVAPYAGIETATVAESAQLIQALARDPSAKLEYVSDANVWAFRVDVPRRGRHTLHIGATSGSYAAGLFATYGTPVRRGPERSWHTAGNNRAKGPILWGDYFLEPVGAYQATVRLSGPGSAQVQLWNTTTNRELAVKTVSLSKTRQVVDLKGQITRRDPKHSAKALRGFGLFQIDPVPAFRGNNLEVRVYAESRSTIKVWHVSLTPVP